MNLHPEVALVGGYAATLLAVAAVLDWLAQHTQRRSERFRTAGFRYHPQHDAWICLQDEMLWPIEYDAEHHLVRYLAKALGVQRLSGQVRLHQLPARAGGHPPAGALAALGGLAGSTAACRCCSSVSPRCSSSRQRDTPSPRRGCSDYRCCCSPPCSGPYTPLQRPLPGHTC